MKTQTKHVAFLICALVVFGSNAFAQSTVYNFDYLYQLEMTHKRKTATLNYYLPLDGDYIGFDTTPARSKGEILTILNLSTNQAEMYMNNGDDKTRMKSPLNMKKLLVDILKEQPTNVELTGRKKEILGYKCIEFLVTGPDMKSKIWVTEEAPVTFSEKLIYNLGFYRYVNDRRIDNPFNSEEDWLRAQQGLVLEMEITTKINSRRPKQHAWKCTIFKKISKTIDPNTYENILGF